MTLFLLTVIAIVEAISVSKQPVSVTKEMIQKWASTQSSCDSMSSSLLNPLRCKNPAQRQKINEFTADFRANSPQAQNLEVSIANLFFPLVVIHVYIFFVESSPHCFFFIENLPVAGYFRARIRRLRH